MGPNYELQKPYSKSQGLYYPRNVNFATKVLLVLYGKGSCGKTSTLRNLIDLLCGQPIITKTKDCRIVIDYKGHVVGVCTAGDDKNNIEKNYEWFTTKTLNGKPIEICIMASREKGDAYKSSMYVTSIAQKGLMQIWINKEVLNTNLSKAGNHSTINANIANKLKDFIDSINNIF